MTNKIRFRVRPWMGLSFLLPLLLLAGPQDFVIQSDVAVPMRDGVVLQGDVWLPKGEGKFPTLVYRTPYGRKRAPEDYTTFRKAVERGYAVLMQDVRGRYGSSGEFNPYFQEGRDGFDTIEWAAKQPWSNGAVGTFGLSYPGAVQWLAAMERPPHLKAMVPAMTFSTPRNFIYSGGVFDGSWIGWIWSNIAPDARVKKNLAGPKTSREARAAWPAFQKEAQKRLPLDALVELKDVAPWYFEWMRHGPDDAWWDVLDLRGKYDRVDAAVLNFSGWYDEAYGPEGATTNFLGLLAARKGQAEPRVKLVIGPWVHGVPGPEDTKAGERDFGPLANIDYDEMVLRWMDRHVRGMENGVDREKRVRVFVMEERAWHEADTWPLPGVKPTPLYLAATPEKGKSGGLDWKAPGVAGMRSSFVSDPANPVVDPHPPYTGGHDYSAMAQRSDVLVFEAAPLEKDLDVVGQITAEIYLSCDAPDTDLWVKLLDVGPDGKAISLMSPGLDVLRASFRKPAKRELLTPGRVYKLEFKNLMTGNRFLKGHRVRVQISATFFPHFSRNLHTGKLETESAEMRKATIQIHYGGKYPSRIVLPVLAH